MIMLRHISLLIALATSLATVAGCKENRALVRMFTCAQIRQVHADMTPSQVHHLLGMPVISHDTNGTNIFDPRTTRSESYHYSSPDWFGHVDWLSIGYAENALVYVVAERMYSDRVFDRASGNNPVLAYRLSTDTGQERREFGPEFERVFNCESSAAPPE